MAPDAASLVELAMGCDLIRTARRLVPQEAPARRYGSEVTLATVDPLMALGLVAKVGGWARVGRGSTGGKLGVTVARAESVVRHGIVLPSGSTSSRDSRQRHGHEQSEANGPRPRYPPSLQPTAAAAHDLLRASRIDCTISNTNNKATRPIAPYAQPLSKRRSLSA